MNLTKQTKSQVRAAIRNAGKWEGHIIPCKMNPKSMWGSSYINRPDVFTDIETFEQTINEFEYYNCNNEVGTYTAFYTKTKGDN